MQIWLAFNIYIWRFCTFLQLQVVTSSMQAGHTASNLSVWTWIVSGAYMLHTLRHLVYGYTLGSQSVTYSFVVTVILTLSSDPSYKKTESRAYILYCFKLGIPNLDCGHMLGCQTHTGWSHFEHDLWHISYIIGGRNPKFIVWIHLGVVECHTLIIDHCLIYENLLSLGYFINLWHNSWFCLIINSQTVQFKGIFIGGTTLFSHRRKDCIATNQYLLFLYQRRTHTAWYEENKLFNFPTLEASALWLYQCLSFQVLHVLPTCILYQRI